MSDLFPSPTAMVKINGSKVKYLRETKGLTQLYLAASVGVTTETISRWENRRYPTIKQENAAKLAETLEVDLVEILEGIEDKAEEFASKIPDTPREIPTHSSRMEPSGHGAKKKIFLILLLVLIFMGGVLLLRWWDSPSPPPSPHALAIRILPAHTPPDSPFPVIITVISVNEAPYSVLLKETLPPGCTIIASSPPHIPVSQEKRTVKWVSRSQGEDIIFALLATCSEEEQKELRFTGSLTLKNEQSTSTSISGSSTIAFDNSHWADIDRNKIISDEEILEAYDRYGPLDTLHYDWLQIDGLWTGSGYFWDPDTKSFTAIP